MDTDAVSAASTSGQNKLRIARVCTIAGSDSGGGAGIQADLKTILSMGCYGLSVITSITAQSTIGVAKDGIHYIPADMIKRQIAMVDDDIAIDAWKIGMLGNSSGVAAVAEELCRRKRPEQMLVLDPVMISTSGSLLLEQDAIKTLVSALFPLCTLVTPNLPEAEAILQTCKTSDNVDHTSLSGLLNTAKILSSKVCGSRAVLLKGGHQKMDSAMIASALEGMGMTRSHEEGLQFAAKDANSVLMGAAEVWQGRWDNSSITAFRTDSTMWSHLLGLSTQPDASQDIVVDILCQPEEENHDSPRMTLFIAPFLLSKSTHGTGCTLSSAIASYLAKGVPLVDACRFSIAYVQAAMARGFDDLGKGPGALDHGCTRTWRGSYEPSRSPDALAQSRYPYCANLISCSLDSWNAYIRHPFLSTLVDEESAASSSSDRSTVSDAFLHFLAQDYHFLLHFSRAYALLASSASSFSKAEHYSTQSLSFAREADLHVRLCERSNISKAALQATLEGPACVAYTRWVLDTVRKEGEVAALTAMLPCILGYAEAGAWLGERLKSRRRADAEAGAPVERNGAQQALDEWIEQYASQDFGNMARNAAKALEDLVARDPVSPLRMRELQAIWTTAVRLEIAFWDEALYPELRRRVATS